jgi:hypothetical protein
MKEFFCQPVPHPPFSSDLAPSDFYLFVTFLRRRSFQDAGELMEAINNVTGSIRPTELNAGFGNWEDRLRRCIELGREYVD